MVMGAMDSIIGCWLLRIPLAGQTSRRARQACLWLGETLGTLLQSLDGDEDAVLMRGKNTVGITRARDRGTKARGTTGVTAQSTIGIAARNTIGVTARSTIGVTARSTI